MQKQWQENGYSGDSVEIKHQLKELKALTVSLQEEKDRITDDREKSELLYKKKIEQLEKELRTAIIDRDGSKEYAERAQKWLISQQTKIKELEKQIKTAQKA